MNCRVCLNSNLTDLVSLGKQYLSDFRADDIKPPKFPLDLVICEECKLVQLKETTPSAYLYTDNYGFESGINGIIKADLENIVQESLKTHKNLPDFLNVLDIGCNDGTLLSNYPKFNTYKVGFDPVPKFREKALKNAHVVISDFFNADKYKMHVDGKMDIITSISMFYDLDDPNQFVLDIEEILNDEGIWVIQQNYLGTMLTQTAYCNICHEHIEYYSLLALENLLSRFNLEVFKVSQNDINGGSFRTFVCHKGTYRIDDSVINMREEEKVQGLDKIDTYKKFAKDIKRRSTDLHNLIKDLNEVGKTVYVYGASTRGNTLLQTSKLTAADLPFAVERNPGKWGKKISSLQIPIISEEEARKHQPSYMLVLPWFLGKEFIERERDYLLAGGAFIFPLPHIKIFTKDDLLVKA